MLSQLNLLLLVFLVQLGASGLNVPAQIPFELPAPGEDVPAGASEDNSNLIFQSLHALMKTWPQAFAPNGHAVVPATIRPDWMAFNAEHSYIFGGGMKRGSPFYVADKLFTYAATRPLRVLYFDGFSASKQGGGVLDLQNVIVYGEAHGGERNEWYGDIERGKLLCEWGIQYGIEGFVREEATYEVGSFIEAFTRLIWCDFAVGLQLISATDMLMPADSNVPFTPAQIPDHDDFSRQLTKSWSPPDLTPWLTPYSSQHAWSMSRAATWHHVRPDGRVTLHPEHLVTLYDSAYSSLASNNRLSRLEHGLVDLSDDDQEAFLVELDGAIRAWNSGHGGSGVDWVTVAQAVVDRNGDRLSELRAFLLNVGPASNLTEAVSNARLVSFALLMPYIDHGALFAPGITPTDRSSVLASVSERCSFAFSGHVDAPFYRLTFQEKRLKRAVEGVLRRICGFASEVLGEALVVLEATPHDVDLAKRKLDAWREGLEELMDWLGWAMWERCPRMCDWDVSLLM
ncbi:hypothetical protein HWV62_31555 [Athelia sp. TMB]|nr:hypothetical protein HWV62_31555 [Athelia sp. TMB]